MCVLLVFNVKLFYWNHSPRPVVRNSLTYRKKSCGAKLEPCSRSCEVVHLGLSCSLRSKYDPSKSRTTPLKLTTSTCCRRTSLWTLSNALEVCQNINSYFFITETRSFLHETVRIGIDNIVINDLGYGIYEICWPVIVKIGSPCLWKGL